MTRLSVLFLFALPLVGCDSAADPEKLEGDEAGGEVGGGVGGEGADGGIGGEGGDGGADGGGEAGGEGADGGTGGETGGGAGGETGGGSGGGTGGDGTSVDFIAPGDPVEAADAWIDAVHGTTWALDLSRAAVREPAGLGDLLLELGVGDDGLALQAWVDGAAALRARGAALDGRGGQDLCAQTGELVGFPAAGDALYLQTEVAWIPFPGAPPGAAMAIEGFELMAVPDSAGGLADVQLAGRLHFGLSADVFAELIGTDSPDEMCALLPSFGVECVPCADGRVACMDIWMTGASGAAADADLVEVEAPCP
jgi:hypothetical protein